MISDLTTCQALPVPTLVHSLALLSLLAQASKPRYRNWKQHTKTLTCQDRCRPSTMDRKPS
ncbi:hypothetical protein MHBO_004962 [Bonamia ostreae]|uniref:Uncharacterized protein n=1 Tax=Bonamia ostreae TaxID=126728 RepID=A0ABV2AVD1_9EUKA